MIDQIMGVVPIGTNLVKVNIFGYTSKGIPGIEIIGVGPSAKIIKEKILFLTKKRMIQAPFRRYVICVENIQSITKDLGEDGAAWLELPILILYWRLVKYLDIQKLEDCFCAGKVTIDGRIECLNIQEEYLKGLNYRLESSRMKLKYITGPIDIAYPAIRVLPVEQLLKISIGPS